MYYGIEDFLEKKAELSDKQKRALIRGGLGAGGGVAAGLGVRALYKNMAKAEKSLQATGDEIKNVMKNTQGHFDTNKSALELAQDAYRSASKADDAKAAFKASQDLARASGVPENRILKTQADIDAVFMNPKKPQQDTADVEKFIQDMTARGYRVRRAKRV